MVEFFCQIRDIQEGFALFTGFLRSKSRPSWVHRLTDHEIGMHLHSFGNIRYDHRTDGDQGGAGGHGDGQKGDDGDNDNDERGS